MDGLNQETLSGYLDRCRMPDGGYCYFHDPENGGGFSSGAGFSNGADTAWALSTYRWLKTDPPKLADTRAWLRVELDRNRITQFSPYLFWFLRGLLLAGGSLSAEDHRHLIRETQRLLDDWATPSDIPPLLEDLVEALSLRREASLSLSEKENQRLADLLEQDPVPSDRPPLPELYTRLFLMKMSGRFSRTAIASAHGLERDYRHPSFGYVLVPGTSRSDLFILRSGLLMRSDPLPPPEAQNLMNLVHACQSREGGCGPIGGAVPTLEATCAALEVSWLLSTLTLERK